MFEDDLKIQEGQVYPGWHKPFESSILSIVAQGLHLLVSIPFPRSRDMDDFKNLTGYGIFEDEYPLIIWKFGKNFLLPTPCNPEFERQEDPEETTDFFSGIHTDFSRVMIDAHGIIRVLRQTRLNPEFIKRLHDLWTAEGLNWKDYNQRLPYTFQTPTHLLWEKSIHFDF
ncbi:MAG: hypothetical protein R6U27_13360 [Desulfobacterales bacterium]